MLNEEKYIFCRPLCSYSFKGQHNGGGFALRYFDIFAAVDSSNKIEEKEGRVNILDGVSGLYSGSMPPRRDISALIDYKPAK